MRETTQPSAETRCLHVTWDPGWAPGTEKGHQGKTEGDLNKAWALVDSNTNTGPFIRTDVPCLIEMLMIGETWNPLSLQLFLLKNKAS